MAKQANAHDSAAILKFPLSFIIRDRRVRAAFERAERDQGDALRIPANAPDRPLPPTSEATPIPA